MNDLLKTQLQETGECWVTNLTVLEIADIVSSLGLDPRTTRVQADRLYVSEDMLMGSQPVTLR